MKPGGLKILVLTNIFPRAARPNAGFYVFEQVKHLQTAAQVKVVVAAAENIFVKPRSTPARTSFAGIEIYEASYGTVPKLGVFFSGYSYYWGLNRLIKNIRRDFSFDLILCYWSYPEGFAAVRWARDFKVPVVIRPRGSDINMYVRHQALAGLVRSTLQRADKVIAVSGDLAQKVRELGVAHWRVAHMLNGVDTTQFFVADQAECRRGLGLPADKRIVLFVGNLIEIKGIEDLLKAIEQLDVEDGTGRLFCFLGQGDWRGRIEEATRRLKTAQIRLAGDVPHAELFRWINSADVTCLPSWHEGCPNIVLESLACGVPVVATNVGGIPELINAPRLGILVGPRQPQELARAISEALARRWDRGQLVNRIKDQTWGKVADRLLQELEDLVRNNKKG